jgi:predicted protein tyrosine phosphatase
MRPGKTGESSILSISANFMSLFTELPFILPVQGAKDLVEKFPYKLNVISATAETPFNVKLCKNHLRLNIFDGDYDNPEHRKLPSMYRFATKEDIFKAVDFSKKHKVHIIHCGAGISRSPAIAYAIFRSEGMNKDAAMAKVMELNPYALPNKWIVKLTDEIYG